MARACPLAPAQVALLFLAGVAGCSTVPTGPSSLMPIHPQRHEAPAWSANGLIAYMDHGVTCVSSYGAYLTDSTKAGIWIYDVHNGSRYRFLSTGGDPAWDPTGQTLTITRGRELRNYRIDGQLQWVLSLRGGPTWPSWAHDGEYLLWEQAIEEEGIWIAQRDSLVPRRVSDRIGYASWNPLQNAVLYVEGDGHGRTTTFYEISLATGLRRTLFALNFSATFPRYSPDGTHIVFSAQNVFSMPPSSRTPELFRVSSRGEGLTRLTYGGGAQAAWSPDGVFLAYVHENPWSLNASSNTLWRSRVATREAVELVQAWNTGCAP